jgi:hypothetical protein
LRSLVGDLLIELKLRLLCSELFALFPFIGTCEPKCSGCSLYVGVVSLKYSLVVMYCRVHLLKV